MLSEDLCHRHGNELGLILAYAKIVRYVEEQGTPFTTFRNMPPPEVLDLGALPEADPNFHQQRGEALYATLNQGQRAFVDDVLRCISDPDHRRNAEGNCYSLTGEGGAGKSRCYETIYHMVRAMNMHVVVMASTGVAATLLPDGKTVHKTFVVDVPTYSDSVCNVKEGTKQANELTRAAVFLWDEISMSQRYVLEAIDLKLQELCNAPGVPFGGAVFIVGGDWRQALPSMCLIFLAKSSSNLLVRFAIAPFSSTWRNPIRTGGSVGAKFGALSTSL